jgi:hypothetical protein
VTTAPIRSGTAQTVLDLACTLAIYAHGLMSYATRPLRHKEIPTATNET